MSTFKTYGDIQSLFQTDTQEYIDYIQPFKSYDDMIYTSVCWGILNKPISCIPREKTIIGDSRRWIYIYRLCGYLCQQEDNDLRHQFTEKNKAYRLSSIESPTKNTGSKTWQIDFNPSLRIIKLFTTVIYGGLYYEDSTMNRLILTFQQARLITAEFIDYFKSICPSDAIKQWSASFAGDINHVDDRNSYLNHKRSQPWRDDLIL